MSAAVLELRDSRGTLVVSLFAPRMTDQGVNAPSMYVHRDVRAGTTGRDQNNKFRLPAMREGLKRPQNGIFFKKAG